MEVIVKSSPKIEIELATKVVKAVGGDVKADGVYPDLVAGDLAGRGESVPAEFGFRASGGKSIKDGRAYIKRIKGNSVVWNQMIPNSRQVYTTTKAEAFNAGTSIIAGHKYILFARFVGTENKSAVSIYTKVNGTNTNIGGLTNNDGVSYKFFTSNYNCHSNGTYEGTEGDIWRYYYFVGTNESIADVRLVDLTQLFQAGNEPTTIEDFNARVATLGVDLNAYNEGEVIHMNTESIKSVGDNAFNGVWYQGAVTENSGQPVVGSLDNIYTDTFRVIGGETYCSQFDGADLYLKGYFFDKSGAFIGSSDFDAWQGTMKWVAPINADSVRMRIYNAVGNITPSQAPNVMIRLDHSGWKSDIGVGYEPYWEDTLPLPIIRKYFPDGMMKAGSAHDEIRFNKTSGKWEAVKRIGEVDMGTFAWGYNNSVGNERLFTLSLTDVMQVPNTETKGGLLTTLYSTASFNNIYSHSSDKLIGLHTNGQLVVYDSAYTDAASFKAMLQEKQVILYYELAEPIVTELDAEDQNFRDYYNVADFGTEEAIPATDAEGNIIPSAAFSADIIYQFNAVDMIREHELEITELQNIIATMQAQLASLTSNNA